MSGWKYVAFQKLCDSVCSIASWISNPEDTVYCIILFQFFNLHCTCRVQKNDHFFKTLVFYIIDQCSLCIGQTQDISCRAIGKLVRICDSIFTWVEACSFSGISSQNHYCGIFVAFHGVRRNCEVLFYGNFVYCGAFICIGTVSACRLCWRVSFFHIFIEGNHIWIYGKSRFFQCIGQTHCLLCLYKRTHGAAILHGLASHSE